MTGMSRAEEELVLAAFPDVSENSTQTALHGGRSLVSLEEYVVLLL